MKLSIYRYDPDKDAKPYMKDYDVPLEPSDRMLLDAMVKAKAQDDSLAFRRSCREGVCGSDAININGRNGLACVTKIVDLPEHVSLRPLPGLPVIRDLIVDMTQFFKQYHSIKPYVVNNDPPPERERLQSRRAERALRVHLVRLLLDILPVVLVEPRQVRRSGRPPAGLPLHRRYARPGDLRAARQPRGSVPPVPLSHDHELRRCVPKGPQPDAGYQQDQGAYGEARRLMDAVARNRLRWKCRRGLLELDLVFEKFIPTVGDEDVQPLCALLELPDNQLWDIISGRSDAYDRRFERTVARLRAA